MIKDVLFAKQPIFDAENNLYGFEILYRSDKNNRASFKNDRLATIELLINYCSGLIDEATGPYVKIFINLSRDLIFSDCFFPLPPDRLVIEILEDIDVDVDLLVRISELKNRGYSFALDDYKFDSKFDDLLTLVDYVKLDVIDLSPEQITKNYKELFDSKFSSRNSNPIVIAEKIEKEPINDVCKKLGFSLFQGYFLARPAMVYGKKLKANSQNALRIVAALQQQDITIEAVCKLVSQDVQQSYMILKIVNSPICHFPRKIQSIQEGVTYLGLKQIKQWAMVMAVTSNPNVPSVLFKVLLERAKCCELYAKEFGGDGDSGFTAGLFSGLDLVLQADKAWLLNQVGLSNEMTIAILNFEGPIGKVLSDVIALEQGQLDNLAELQATEKLSLMDASLQGAKWVNELYPLINSAKNG